MAFKYALLDAHILPQLVQIWERKKGLFASCYELRCRPAILITFFIRPPLPIVLPPVRVPMVAIISILSRVQIFIQLISDL
jgi:hypothetical protein